jgi:hypothetical protein
MHAVDHIALPTVLWKSTGMSESVVTNVEDQGSNHICTSGSRCKPGSRLMSRFATKRRGQVPACCPGRPVETGKTWLHKHGGSSRLQEHLISVRLFMMSRQSRDEKS